MAKATFWERAVAEGQAAERRRQRESADSFAASSSAAAARRAEAEAAVGMPGAAPSPISADSERLILAQRRADDRREQLAQMVSTDDAAEDEQIVRGLGGGGGDRGEPTAFDVAGVAGTGSAVHGARGDQIEAALLAGRYVPGRRNPLAPIRRGYQGDMLGGQPTGEIDEDGNPILSVGLAGEEKAGNEQLVQAQVQEQRAYAEHYAAEEGRLQARADQVQFQSQRQSEQRQAQIAASQTIMKKVSDAADRLNEAPDIDPNRYWASQSAGRKFAWALQAGFSALGGLDPFGALQSAINKDIDAQKASFAQKQAGFAARMDELGASRSIYQDIRESIGDEQVADQVMEMARLEQSKAGFAKIASQQGVSLAQAQGNVFLNQIDQRIAELRQSIGSVVATTPERIGGGWRPNVAGPRRKVLEQRLKFERERQGKTEDLAITEGGRAATAQTEARGRVEAERVKQEGEASTAELQKFATQTDKAGQVIDLIDQFIDDYGDSDIPGRGASSVVDYWMRPNERATAKAKLSIITDAIGRLQSQGAVTPDEEARFSEWLSAGVGDKQLLSNLRNAQELAKTLIARQERALSDRGRTRYRRTEQVPDFEADLTGARGRLNAPAGSRGVVQED